ncbi:hypothetical protein CEXT_129921 [Caerostris extrusa]|uniref:Uncharacterized protein n=1 Tax=Caerostris extrusa TaxID=172846 RepID=A0AAV4W945_CAEEX|nr:hypothetical protein CEXT_129921 [Caerostris extrusa]
MPFRVWDSPFSTADDYADCKRGIRSNEEALSSRTISTIPPKRKLSQKSITRAEQSMPFLWKKRSLFLPSINQSLFKQWVS